MTIFGNARAALGRALLCTTILLAACGGSDDGPSGSDNNDTFASATTVSLPYTTTTSISSETDTDFYKFTVPAAGTIAVTMSGLAADLDMSLFNSAQSEVDWSAAGGTTPESIVFLAPAAGTYYVQVYWFFGSTPTNYTLSVSFTP